MAANVIFSESGLMNPYQSIRRGDPTNWAIWTVTTAGPINEAKLVAQGSGGLEELEDQFADGKAMWAYARVPDSESARDKFVLINWLGEGVPEVKRGLFPQYSSQFASRLSGAHAVIQAHSEDDVTPQAILSKVNGSSQAAGYGTQSSQTKGPVPTRLAQTTTAPKPVSTPKPTEPLGTIPLFPNQVRQGGRPTSTQTTTARGNVIDRDWSPPKRTGHNVVNTVPDLDADEKPVSFAGQGSTPTNSTSNDPPPAPVFGAPKPMSRTDTKTQSGSASPTTRIANLNLTDDSSKPPSQTGESGVVTDAGPVGPVGTTYEPVKIGSVGKLKNRWPDVPQQNSSSPSASISTGKVGSSIKDRSAAFQKGGVVPTYDPVSKSSSSAASSFARTNTSANPSTYETNSYGTPASSSAIDNHAPDRNGTPPPPPPPPPAPSHAQPSSNKASIPDDDFDDAPPPPPPAPLAPPAPPAPPAPAASDDTSAVPPPPPPPPAPPAPSSATTDNKASLPDDDFDDAPAPAIPSRPGNSAPSSASVPPPPPPPPAPPAPSSAAATDNKASLPDDDFDDAPAPALPTRPGNTSTNAAPPAPPAPPVPESVTTEQAAPVQAPPSSNFSHDDGKAVIAIADYDAAESDEISTRVNQVIRLVETLDENWLTGESLDGHKGSFPASYVEVLTEGSGDALPAATALYSYTAAEDGEISLEEGHPIQNIKFVSEEWWHGSSNGADGLFPAAYVTFFQQE